MQPYRDTVLSMVNGKLTPVSGASVLVKTYPGLATATIYSDNGVTTATNPLTTDTRGAYTFFAADGRYQLVISGTSFDTITIPEILLEDPLEGATVASLSTATSTSVGNLSTGVTSLSTGLSTTNSSLTSLSTGTSTSVSSLSTAISGGGVAQTSGTFTPYAEGNSLAGIGTYGYRAGQYTQIGEVIFFQFELGWTAHTGTGDLLIKFPDFPEVMQTLGSIKLFRSGLPLGTTNSVSIYEAGGECTLSVYAGNGTYATGEPAVNISSFTGTIAGAGFVFAV